MGCVSRSRPAYGDYLLTPFVGASRQRRRDASEEHFGSLGGDHRSDLAPGALDGLIGALGIPSYLCSKLPAEPAAGIRISISRTVNCASPRRAGPEILLSHTQVR